MGNHLVSLSSSHASSTPTTAPSVGDKLRSALFHVFREINGVDDADDGHVDGRLRPLDGGHR